VPFVKGRDKMETFLVYNGGSSNTVSNPSCVITVLQGKESSNAGLGSAIRLSTGVVREREKIRKSFLPVDALNKKNEAINT